MSHALPYLRRQNLQNAQNVPEAFSFQGYVEFEGVPANAEVQVVVNIWSDAIGTSMGDLVYSETHEGVAILDGILNLDVGTGVVVDPFSFSASLFDQSPLWIELEIDGETIEPRRQLLSATIRHAAPAASLPTLLSFISRRSRSSRRMEHSPIQTRLVYLATV